ncbi:hypothetical protein EYF80_026421 [Liparis tanakae]|uniref:Uncharacterized protein n=1 Tax=Liparis tanakae TaxID=230148 RepID=A0A4Z2HBX3_9TELE|nr:hypothetical protein EYF80_026421 [Liparis tanakae]
MCVAVPRVTPRSPREASFLYHMPHAGPHGPERKLNPQRSLKAADRGGGLGEADWESGVAGCGPRPAYAVNKGLFSAGRLESEFPCLL